MGTTLFEKKWGKDFLSTVPGKPGVYWFTNQEQQWIYVGKAKNLKRRLSQYRKISRKAQDRKRGDIVRQATDLRYQVLNSEEAALLEENRLIQLHRPPFNIEGKFSFLYSSIGVFQRERNLYLCLSYHSDPFSPFTFYGCFRSPQLTKEAFTSLVSLLGSVGHKENRAALKEFAPPKFVKLVGFRQMDKQWVKLIEQLLSGQSTKFLSELSLALVESTSARRNRERIQQDLSTIQAFFKVEAMALRAALTRLNMPYGWVSQDNRDPLFIKSRNNI